MHTHLCQPVLPASIQHPFSLNRAPGNAQPWQPLLPSPGCQAIQKVIGCCVICLPLSSPDPSTRAVAEKEIKLQGADKLVQHQPANQLGTQCLHKFCPGQGKKWVECRNTCSMNDPTQRPQMCGTVDLIQQHSHACCICDVDLCDPDSGTERFECGQVLALGRRRDPTAACQHQRTCALLSQPASALKTQPASATRNQIDAICMDSQGCSVQCRVCPHQPCNIASPLAAGNLLLSIFGKDRLPDGSTLFCNPGIDRLPAAVVCPGERIRLQIHQSPPEIGEFQRGDPSHSPQRCMKRGQL